MSAYSFIFNLHRRHEKKTTTISGVILLLCGFLIFAGCDQTFQPLQENEEYYFSIYGYLDAAADTQWVRVGPARRAVNEPPDPTGIKVTLEHVQSGQSVIMNDSLFSSGNFLNYWTTLDILNEQTYRITAERDGKSSRVTVTTPKELPTPHVLIGSDVFSGRITVTVYIDDSVGQLADVQTKWYVLLQPDGLKQKATYTFFHRNSAKHTTAYNGSFFVDYFFNDQLRNIEERNSGSDMDIVHRQIFVAAAGPEWDETIPSITDLEYFLNSTASNVENGLGYVVGIDTKFVPLRTCLDGELHIPCDPEEPFW